MPSFAPLCVLLLFLCSCQLKGPKYEGPVLSQPLTDSFLEDRDAGHHLNLSWSAFEDRTLSSYQRRLVRSNFDLRTALFRRNQARAALGTALSARQPQVSASASATRNRSSDNSLGGGFGDNYYSLYQVTGSLSYELDLWGRIQRQVEAGIADTQAAEANISSVLLSLQSQFARSYFALRFLDAEAGVLRDAVASREETLALAKTREESGLTSGLDAARAEGELARAEAALLSLAGPRAQLKYSLAVLLGQNPSSFRLKEKKSAGTLPIIHPGLPLSLLSRRPDLAVAERRLAAATARIGVAEARFYPELSLTGSGGLASLQVNDFLKKSSTVSSVGPSLTAPIFQGGRLRANLTRARAEQQEALTVFQQATLQAIAEVESALASAHARAREAEARRRTVEASREAFRLSRLRYREGVDNYLGVIDAQRELLEAERASVRTRGQRFTAAVELIQALGGPALQNYPSK